MMRSALGQRRAKRKGPPGEAAPEVGADRATRENNVLNKKHSPIYT
ncbi:hypothetical protein C8J43_101223 [Sphingomonas sp. PP-CE-1G-424]|nr:hypothetical protein C8J43_101223 [Sphingomonas sp. PP-CE-1G-424]